MTINYRKAIDGVRKYRWKAGKGDDPTKRAHDRVMFSRYEGYEVVAMVRQVSKHFDYTTQEEARRVAEVIATELPSNVRSRKNVFNWLVDYISKHS